MLSRRCSLFVLVVATLVCAGCGAGRGQASLSARTVVEPDGSTSTLTILDVRGPVGDAPVDAAITQASRAAGNLWSAVAASNAWITLAWEQRRGLTRDAYAERLRRQQTEAWYRIEMTARDKTEAYERQLALFDQIHTHQAAGTDAAQQRQLREEMSARIVPAVAAYQALAAVAAPDDALLRVVAAYNQGICAGLAGDYRRGAALLDEAHGYAVRHVDVAIIRQCQRGQQDLQALEKTRLLFQADERNRQRTP